MPFHPNVIQVRRIGDHLTIDGKSPQDAVVLQTLVVLEYEGKVAHALAKHLDAQWTAEIAVSQLTPAAPATAPAVGRTVLAFGSETRTDPVATVTWSQIVTIAEP